MLFHLESLEEKNQIVNMRETKLDHRNYHDFNTRVIFYVGRIGLYLYKYRIYGTITKYILKDLAFVYQLVYILHH